VDKRKGQAAIDAGAKPSDTPQKLWFDQLKKDGIKITDDELPVGELTASQAEISPSRSSRVNSTSCQICPS